MSKRYTITTSEGVTLDRTFNLSEAAEMILTENGHEFVFSYYCGFWKLHTKVTFFSNYKASQTRTDQISIIYSHQIDKIEAWKEIAEIVVECSKNWLGYPTATETEEDDDQGSPAA